MSRPDPHWQSDSRTRLAEETIDVRALLVPVWRRKWLILVIMVLAAAGAYLLTSRQAKVYDATARVLVQNADPAASIAPNQPANAPTPQALQDIATVITGAANTAAADRAIALQLGTGGTVSAAPEPNSTFVDVTASSHSPSLAAQLANSYVQAFEHTQSQAVAAAAKDAANAAQASLRTLPATSANESQRSSLLAEIAGYKTIEHNPLPGVSVVDPALVPSSPTSPRPVRNALIAAVIGLLLALVLAFLLEWSDRRLVRVSTVETIYEQPVVAVLPHVFARQRRGVGEFLTPAESVEPMRSLRVNLRLAAGGRPLRSVLVTSALPAEGKSTVVRDLAFACADAGERVLVIDCDLRRPSMAGMFAIKPEPGLVHVLRGEAKPEEATAAVFRTMATSNGNAANSKRVDPRAHGGIDLIAHGEHLDSPGALLASGGMSSLLATAASTYDIVVIDTSPILTVSDAVPLLGEVSAVLFVARLGVTTRDAGERLTELGERVPDMNLVGVVVNDMRGRYPDEGYSTYSQYGYSYSHSDTSPYAPFTKD